MAKNRYLQGKKWPYVMFLSTKIGWVMICEKNFGNFAYGIKNAGISRIFIELQIFSVVSTYKFLV